MCIFLLEYGFSPVWCGQWNAGENHNEPLPTFSLNKHCFHLALVLLTRNQKVCWLPCEYRENERWKELPQESKLCQAPPKFVDPQPTYSCMKWVHRRLSQWFQVIWRHIRNTCLFFYGTEIFEWLLVVNSWLI